MSVAAGRPLEPGPTRLLDTPDDVVLKPYERGRGAMEAYLRTIIRVNAPFDDNLDQFIQFTFIYSRLGRFMSKVNLNQHRQFRAAVFVTNSIQPACERNRIERMDHVKQRDGFARFV